MVLFKKNPKPTFFLGALGIRVCCGDWIVPDGTVNHFNGLCKSTRQPPPDTQAHSGCSSAPYCSSAPTENMPREDRLDVSAKVLTERTGCFWASFKSMFVHCSSAEGFGFVDLCISRLAFSLLVEATVASPWSESRGSTVKFAHISAVWSPEPLPLLLAAAPIGRVLARFMGTLGRSVSEEVSASPWMIAFVWFWISSVKKQPALKDK